MPALIAGHVGFVLKESLGREITWLSPRGRFRKAPVLKFFLSAVKHKAVVFKFLWIEKYFRKALFSWRICVDGRLNHRNKAAL